MKKFNGIFILCVILFLVTLLCCFSSFASQSASKAINLCVFSIIPSLLPIMILTTVIINLNLICVVPQKITVLFLFFISLISGFPVGAKLLNDCVLNKTISKDSAKKLLPSFINAGPGFVVGTIGIKIFNNEKLGLLLLISQVTASFLLFCLTGGFKIRIKETSKSIRFSDAFNQSVTQATKSVATISALVILFTVISDLFSFLLHSKISTIIACIFEISTAVSKVNNPFVICILLSICGMCVYMQVYSNIKAFFCNIFNLLFLRAIHSIISFCTFKFLLKIFPISISVFSSTKTDLNASQSFSTIVTILMGLILISFLLSFNKKSSGKLEKDLI